MLSFGLGALLVLVSSAIFWGGQRLGRRLGLAFIPSVMLAFCFRLLVLLAGGGWIWFLFSVEPWGFFFGFLVAAKLPWLLLIWRTQRLA